MSDSMENKEAEIMEQDNNLTQCMCEFCGQVLEVDEKVMANAGQDIKVAASLICDCEEAKRFKGRYMLSKKGIDMVDNVCGRRSGRPLERDLVHLLHNGVSLIVKNQAVGITLNVSPKEKVELKLGSKGIKCSRTVKETRVDECRT